MARYLVYTSPARGHLYPIVPTLEELRRRGHEVTVRTLASEVGLLRELGFEAEAIDPAIERKEHTDWRARTPIGALQVSLRVFFERARHDGPDLRGAIEEERPDALLADIATSVTAVWASPRRRSLRASPCASCRSVATSSTLPGTSRSQARAPGCPPPGCAPPACKQRCRKRWARVRAQSA